MGPTLADRVRESSSTTGTGDFALEGAVSGGFRAFSDVLAINDTTYYVIQNSTFNEWEVGIGTLTGPTTLQRTAVLSSSNSNNLVNFSSGTKSVFADAPAALLSITGLVLEATPDTSNDLVAIYNVSSGGIKKALLSSVGGFTDPMTTLGDMIYRGGGGTTRLGIGLAGQVLTVAAGIPSWTTPSVPATAPFPDTTSIVEGSADPTKEIRFEVDGLTTGTVRVLTPPDADINLPGTNIVNIWVLVQTFSSSPTAPWAGASSERFGAGAGNAVATGTENIAIGSGALETLAAGVKNVAVGVDALNLLAGGSSNTAVGWNSLLNANTASLSVGVGYESLLAVTSGVGNIGIGYKASSKITSDHWSVAVGYLALGEATGLGNVQVGAFSTGVPVLTTGTENVLLGYNTDTTTAGTSRTVAIGSYAASTTNGECAFGPYLNYWTLNAFSSTPQIRTQVSLETNWLDSTDATRKAQLVVSVWDTAKRAAFHCDADGTGANFSFFGTGSYGTGTNVICLRDAAVDPTTDPAVGGILYCTAGALTWRGQSSTVTTIAAAGPHCGRCGYDFWSIACRNDRWQAYLYICGMCGKKYRKGPRSVLSQLTAEQRAEIME